MQGLYVNGGIVNITGTFSLGTNPASNSGVNARQDSGSMTVGGTTFITDNNGGRWSIFQVNGGTFTSNDSVGGGIVIGGTYAATNGEFLVSGGTATAQKISLGDATQTSGTDALVLSGGTLYLGAGGIVSGNATPTYSSTISAGNATLGAVANWSSSLPISLLGPTTLQAADSLGNAHNFTLGGAIGGASGSLIKSGAGEVLLTGVNSYALGTTINAGDLAVNANAALGSTAGSVLINAGTLEATTGFTSARQFKVNNTGSTIIVDASQTLTLTTGLTNGTGTGTLNVTGPGVLALAGPGTYTGGTVVGNGTLQLQNASALGNGLVTVNSPGVVDLNGNSVSFTGLTGNGTINSVSNTGASVLTLGANNASNIFAGLITNTAGSVGFTAAGTGVQTLSGANTYSGPTTINSGSTLVLASSAGSVTPGTVTNTGTFSITGTASVGNVAGAGSTSVAVGGALTTNGFTQTTLTSNGTTTVNGSGTVGSIAGGGTLNIGSTASLALTETQSTSQIGALDIAAGGTFDVSNNALLINYAAAGLPSPDAAIRADLISGSGTNGVTYNGVGIISSTAARLNAALVANGGTPKYGVGYADGSDPYLNSEGPAAGTEEVKLTLLGD
jgi:autotransporter-associated beta strand protein